MRSAEPVLLGCPGSRPLRVIASHGLGESVRSSLLVLAALLSCSAIRASEVSVRLGDAWRWRVFDREDGIGPGISTALYQDSDDHVYSATERGITRYDLHHWDIVDNVDSIGEAPFVRFVESSSAVYCATPRSLWSIVAGTRLVRVHPAQSDGRGAGTPIFVAANRAGEVFLVDGRDHFHVREELQRIEGTAGVPPDVLDYEIDIEGVHWIATRGGVYYQDPSIPQARWIAVRPGDMPFPNAECVRWLRAEIPVSGAVSRLQRQRAHELWGVFRIAGSESSFRLARPEARAWVALPGPAFDSEPDGIALDARGVRFVTCDNGRLWVVEPMRPRADGVVEPIVERVARLGVGPVRVHGAFVDSGGSLWFRLGSGGLAIVDIASERWERLPLPGFTEPPFPRVTSLLETRDGGLWAGTTELLVHYPPPEIGGNPDRSPVVFRSVLDTPLREVSALGEQDLGRDTPGRIWIGSESFPGLFVYEPNASFTEANGEARGRRPGSWQRVALSAAVHRIRRDQRNDLWFLPGPGRSDGAPQVFRLSPFSVDERTPSTVRITSGIPSYRPTTLAINDLLRVAGPREDAVWLATEDGLLTARLEDEDELVIDERRTDSDGLISSRIWAVDEGPDGSIWICYPSSGRGLTRILPGEKPETYDTRQGLSGPEVWSIARSGPNLWFATDMGLSRFDGEFWYRLPIEAESSRSTRVVAVIGSVALAGESGVLAGTTELGIWRLRLDDKRRPRFRKIEFPDEVSEGRPITFRWRARDYKNETPADRLSYRYRIDDGDWTYIGAIDSVTIDAGLAPGHHTFELDVRDADGNRSRDVSERIHEFRVSPRSPLWPTTLMAVSIAAVVIAFAIARVRVRRRSMARLASFEKVFLASPDAVFIVDASGRVVEYNGKCGDLIGVPLEELPQIRGRSATLVPIFVALGLDDTLRRALAGDAVSGRVSGIKTLPIRSECTIEVTAFPFRDARSGDVLGAMISLRDRTLEASAERLISRERRLDSLRDFAQRISAELARPQRSIEARIAEGGSNSGLHRLREILRGLELFAGTEDAPRQGEVLRHGEEVSKNDGSCDVEASLEALLGPLRGGFDVVSSRPSVPGKRISVDCRTATGLWTVRVDDAVLRDVFGAIIDNAVDAQADRGTLTVRAANVRVEGDAAGLPDGRFVEVSFRDEGIGIDPLQIESVFDPFFSTKARDRARGLGLSLALAAVRRLGGDIRLESRVGGGTTVRVLLPATPATP
jgi:signal transduction histidine kinase